MRITSPTSETSGDKGSLSGKASGKTCSFDVCQECPVCCCRDAKPPLTEERVRKIKYHLRKNGVAIGQIFEKRGYVFPVLDEVGFCVFYEKKTKRCKVHEVKPETCVAGPVTFDINYQTGKVEWFLKTAEICALAGKLDRDREQLAVHLKIARQRLLELINRLDAESLRVILKIEEPQTFKIGEETLATGVAKRLHID